MPTTKRRVLKLRRAVYHAVKGQAPPNTSLEDYLTEAHRVFKTVATRRCELDSQFVLEVLHTRKRRQGGGTLIQLCAYTRDEPATIVPRPAVNSDDEPLRTVPPPKNSDFMDGDLLLLVAGNNVLMCANQLRERKFEIYCSEIFTRADMDARASMFQLAPVANVDKLQVIESEGVKKISLDLAAYSATVQHVQQTSTRRTVRERAQDLISLLFADEPNIDELRNQENLSAEVVIKFDQRRKGGAVGRDRMAALAKTLVEEPEAGFKIETFGHSILGHDDISLQKAVDIRADGKTVSREAAFTELVTYFQELKDAGHLD